jgi:ketosteroid isomerase-like protein
LRSDITDLPDTITRYFEADARRDTDALLALFSEEAIVIDEGEAHSGTGGIRSWREEVTSKYEYTTEVVDAQHSSENEYVLTGRLTGNFPGGTADLTWRFTLEGDHINRLHTA